MDAQEGSRSAMERLVRRWQKRLWRHAYRMTGDVDAAWEVTQQGWLAIIRGLNRLGDPAKFRAWAYRIVTHKAVDWVRRRRAARGVVCLDDVSEPPMEPAVSETTKPDLAEVVSGLEAPQRNVVNLYYFERFSVREIADILRIPVGTVKSRLNTARTILRRRLEGRI